MIRIALDVMGGDNAPDINIEAAHSALGSIKDLYIILTGPEALIRERTAGWESGILSRTEIADAPTVITPAEHPVQAIKKKKDSSIVVGTRLVRTHAADAFISAGSSGAILAAGQLVIGRMKGVHRTPLATMLPTMKGYSFFMDCGANVDARPEWLVQYAVMGSIYMDRVMKMPNASVKLVNLGTEEEKGDQLVQAVHARLLKTPGINYQGFIESRDVVSGEADIVITDAFTGNAIIKTFEGVGGMFISMVKDVLGKNILTKLAALMIMGPLKEKLSSFDAAKCGGAIMLGLNGVVIKCHGNARPAEIEAAIEKACAFAREDVNGTIAHALQELSEA